MDNDEKLSAILYGIQHKHVYGNGRWFLGSCKQVHFRVQTWMQRNFYENRDPGISGRSDGTVVIEQAIDTAPATSATCLSAGCTIYWTLDRPLSNISGFNRGDFQNLSSFCVSHTLSFGFGASLAEPDFGWSFWSTASHKDRLKREVATWCAEQIAQC